MQRLTATIVDGLSCLLLRRLEYTVEPEYSRSQSGGGPVLEGPHSTHRGRGVKGRGTLKGAIMAGSWKRGDVMDPPSRAEWRCPGRGRVSSAQRSPSHSPFVLLELGKGHPSQAGPQGTEGHRN